MKNFFANITKIKSTVIGLTMSSYAFYYFHENSPMESVREFWFIAVSGFLGILFIFSGDKVIDIFLSFLKRIATQINFKNFLKNDGNP